jgi:hypothetical protein
VGQACLGISGSPPLVHFHFLQFIEKPIRSR